MTYIRQSLAVFLLLISLLFIPAHYAHATSLGVDPLSMELTPGKSGAIRVKNSGSAPTPVEVLIYERIVDEDGNQTRREADDDFIVFPPQAVIDPSSVQVIRIQPVIADVSESKSYYVTVKQIPVQLDEKPNGYKVNIIFAFDSAVHVVPRGVEAVPVALSAKPSVMTLKNNNVDSTSTEATTIPAVEIEMENEGNRFLYLQDYDYEISGTDISGKAININGWSVSEIIETVPVILVGPNSRRKFKLPLPDGIVAKDLTVRIQKR